MSYAEVERLGKELFEEAQRLHPNGGIVITIVAPGAQISQTGFCRPFCEWKFDEETSKTRKPFDRMVAVTQRFLEILEGNGL